MAIGITTRPPAELTAVPTTADEARRGAVDPCEVPLLRYPISIIGYLIGIPATKDTPTLKLREGSCEQESFSLIASKSGGSAVCIYWRGNQEKQLGFGRWSDL